MKSELQVRTAGPADAAEVDQVLLASYPALMAEAYDGSLLARALPMLTRANPTLLASGTYYMVDADGEAIGCGGWTPDDPCTGALVPGVAHIRHFAVAPNWAGTGVGRALYARCESEARKAGVHGFECYASRNAKPFYAALGFTAVRDVTVSMGAVEFPSILMRRTLT